MVQYSYFLDFFCITKVTDDIIIIIFLVPPSTHIWVDEGLASEEGFDNDGKNYIFFTVCNLFVVPQ